MPSPKHNLLSLWADDYQSWCENNVYLKGKDGQPFLLNRPNPGQLKLRASPNARQRVLLKARQTGGSSEIASQYVHQALFNPGSSIAVIAQTDRGARNMSDLYGHIVEHLPDRFYSKLFRATVNIESITFPGLNSEIVFGSANSVSMRGSPRQGCHITEAAFAEDLTKTLEALRPTVHGPLILESTANGPGPFHLLWNDPHVVKVFISWLDDPTCVSDQPIPDDLTDDELIYIDNHRLTIRQVSWFIQQLRSTNWDSFKQEHPAIPQEAFLLGGDRFFSVSFFPADTSRFQPLVVHQEPKRGRRYVIGADPASGSKTGDRSACVLLDVTDPDNVTTAVSYANRIPPKDFAKVVADLSKRYFNCIVCVERNAGWGLAVLDHLRTNGTPLYRKRVFDKTKKHYLDIFGFDTTRVTRPLILAKLQEAINSRQYVPNDARIEEEANAFRFTQGSDGQRPEATPGCHDDLILAAALALQCASQAKDTTLIPDPKELSADPTLREILEYELNSGELYEEEQSLD